MKEPKDGLTLFCFNGFEDLKNTVFERLRSSKQQKIIFQTRIAVEMMMISTILVFPRCRYPHHYCSRQFQKRILRCSAP